jgi:hypothetical protein
MKSARMVPRNTSFADAKPSRARRGCKSGPTGGSIRPNSNPGGGAAHGLRGFDAGQLMGSAGLKRQGGTTMEPLPPQEGAALLASGAREARAHAVSEPNTAAIRDTRGHFPGDLRRRDTHAVAHANPSGVNDERQNRSGSPPGVHSHLGLPFQVRKVAVTPQECKHDQAR